MARVKPNAVTKMPLAHFDARANLLGAPASRFRGSKPEFVRGYFSPFGRRSYFHSVRAQLPLPPACRRPIHFTVADFTSRLANPNCHFSRTDLSLPWNIENAALFTQQNATSHRPTTAAVDSSVLTYHTRFPMLRTWPRNTISTVWE
jgi:hypothetical protein